MATLDVPETPSVPLTQRMLRLTAEGDLSAWSEQHIETANPSDGAAPSGMESWRIAYRMGMGWKFLRVIPHQLAAISSSKRKEFPSTFGLWLRGDGQGCQPRIRFSDSTGQLFQAEGPKIDWKGWRYVTFPMQSTDGAPLAHWSGADDGVIHYPIKWDTIFLLDNVSKEPVKGEIYLSAPTLIY
jgi:hypothetical protein